MKLKNILNTILVGAMLKGCAFNTNQNIKPITQEIEYREDMSGRELGAYRTNIVKNAGLEERSPNVKSEELGPNISKLTTEYADGTLSETLFFEDDKSISVSNKTLLGPIDHPYEGICDRPWDVDHVGAGYFADQPTKGRLKDLVGVEKGLFDKEVSETETKTEDGYSRVKTTCYNGTIYGPLTDFDHDFLKLFYGKIDTDGNKIITSYEARQYVKKQHRFDSE